MDLKTSTDFQSGYDAASKARQLIMDAQEAENARLRAALEPFARHADNVSLSGALAHICREDLLRAHAALARSGHAST